MACLYIDRLKSKFQRGHHFDQRASNGETWCPRLSMDRLLDYKSELCYTSDVPPSTSVAVKFNPVVPRIFTIGLHFNHQKMNNDHLSILTIKDLLKRYLDNVIRRYRSYSRTSSKLAHNETCDQNMCSLHSIVCIVSKCSKEFARNIWDIHRRKEHATVGCKCQGSLSRDWNVVSGNIREANNPDEQHVEQQPSKEEPKEPSAVAKKKTHRYTDATDSDESALRAGLTTERTIDRAVSSVRSNVSGHLIRSERRGSLTSGRKKDISVQTSRRRISHRKDHRRNKSKRKRKENPAAIPREMPSSKDIETIFRTNSEDFNRKESKLNVDLSKTRRSRETSSSSHRNKKKNKISSSKGTPKQRETKYERNNNLTRIYQKYSKRERPVSTKTQSVLTSDMRDNLETVVCDRVQFQEYETASKREEKRYVSGTVETVFDHSFDEIVTVSRIPRNYQPEDKTSEITILGNVKKRLEKDYDDYFSFDEFDAENDADGNPVKVAPKIDHTASDTATVYHEPEGTLESKVLMTKGSMTGHRALKHSAYNSEARNTSCKKSLEANLTYSFSIHCTNSDLSHSQSSYHTPLREQNDSQCSSVEYCSASNKSSSNVSRVNQNFGSLRDPRNFSSNRLTYNCALDALSASICSPDDLPIKSNPIFQNSGEYSDEALINLDAMQIRSNSTPNLSNSSKLVTESLDSGVLTDYSLDHLVSSNERLQKTTSTSPIEFDCPAGELNLLQTYDFNMDASYSDDSLNRRVDIAVKKFTEDLAMAERKARLKLRRLEQPSKCAQRKRQRSRKRQVKESSVYTVECNSSCNRSCNFNSFYWSYDDDQITGCSTPPFVSFSDSEIDQIDHT